MIVFVVIALSIGFFSSSKIDPRKSAPVRFAAVRLVPRRSAPISWLVGGPPNSCWHMRG